MGEWQRKRSGLSFCFGADSSVGEEKARKGGGAITAAPPHRHLRRRLLAKVFRSPAISPCMALNRCESKESRRSVAPRKGMDLRGEEHDRKADSIFSSSTSSSSSSSSSSAVSSSRFPSAFVTALREPEEPTNPRTKRSPPKSAAEELKIPLPDSWVAPIGILLLVVSLSVVVFYGRVCAIAWTSSLLFVAACLCCVLEDPELKQEEECAPDVGAPVTVGKRGGAEEESRIL